MLKKISICIFCIWLTATSVLADINEVSVDSGSGVISVSGTGQSNSKVSVIITKPGVTLDDLSETTLKNQVIIVYESVCNENGDYGILIRMPQDAVSDKYNIWVNGKGMEFYYADAKELKTALLELQGATTENIESIINKFACDKKVFYLETGDEYDSYMKDEKSNLFFCSAMIGFIKEQTELTADDAVLCFNKALEFTRYSFGTSENITKALNNNYLGMKLEAGAEAEKAAEILYGIRVITDDKSVLQNEIRTSYAVAEVNSSTKGVMTSVLEKYNDVLNLDLDGKYSKSDKIQVNKALCGKNFKSVSEIKKAFDKACSYESGNHGKPSNSSSGSSGSGGGFSVDSKSNNSVTPAEEKAFSDLDDVPWASEYINKLYSLGIASGVNDSEFEPMRNVTREEFLKILLLAFKIQMLDGNSSFSDVKSGTWYEKYVESAANYGIVKGINEKYFGIGKTITREDACVMTARVLEKKGVLLKESDINFRDSESVSDYAAEAVGKLCGAEIISGMANGGFEPQSFLTRAQAAKIVYLGMKAGENN